MALDSLDLLDKFKAASKHVAPCLPCGNLRNGWSSNAITRSYHAIRSTSSAHLPNGSNIGFREFGVARMSACCPSSITVHLAVDILIKKLQVLGAVVGSVSIDVVYMLLQQQRSSKNLRHDVAMFIDSRSIGQRDTNVTILHLLSMSTNWRLSWTTGSSTEIAAIANGLASVQELNTTSDTNDCPWGPTIRIWDSLSRVRLAFPSGMEASCRAEMTIAPRDLRWLGIEFCAATQAHAIRCNHGA